MVTREAAHKTLLAKFGGHVYSAEEVKSFYATRGNQYNFPCAVTSVLIGDDGKPMLTKNLSDRTAEERKKWEDEYRSNV
jgi:hypothetical protein